MASIKDVARAAGVSNALVSRYLNGQTGVSPANRDKIAEAVKALGYRRNDIARSLVQQKTGAIGVIVDTVCAPFFFELIHGLETGGQETGYKIIFCDCMNDVQIKKKYIDYLSHSRVDGLVLYGSLFSDNAVVAELSGSTFPYVLIENDVPGVIADKVLVDNRGGARQMVRRLYQRGYRDIRTASWMLDTQAGRQRQDGFKDGLAECGLPLTKESIYPVGTAKAAQEMMRTFIAARKLPEAMFFGADILAFAALEVCMEAGVRIPEDMAVTGFDNDFYMSRDILMPRLTTLEQPLFEMGRTAIQMLVDRIVDPSLPAKAITYTVKLIEGVTD